MNKRIIAVLIGISLLMVRGGTSVKAGPPLATDTASLLAGESETQLSNGQLLLIGGQGADGRISQVARIVDTNLNTSRSIQLKFSRAWHTATALPDGSVLVLGGLGDKGSVVTSSELFHPETGAFEVINGPSARAFHTATLTTDGLVAIIGGVAADGSILNRIEMWDFRNGKSTLSGAALSVARWGHNATLMADSTVLITGGKAAEHQPAAVAERFDPARQSISPFKNHVSPPSQVDMTASSPENNAIDVSLDTLIAVRFSRPVLMRSLNSQNLTITAPTGSVNASVFGAEKGMLAFINPKQPLAAGTTYIVDVRGVSSPEGNTVPFWEFTFTTVGTAADLAGLGSSIQDLRSLPSLKAKPGITALAGQVLSVTGTALPGVTVSIGDRHTRTDGTGRFLLSEASPGHQVLLVDADHITGGENSKQGFGIYEIGVDVKQGTTTALSYTIWLTAIDKAHAIEIPSPTTQETVITTPLIPGLELHLPAGTVITDYWGKTVREIIITPIDAQKPPFPLPFGTPLFFTIQPGSAYIKAPSGSGARLIYPNITNAAPNSFVPFWDYDANVKGWFVYGYGNVTADGKQVIPNPGVQIYEFTGAMINGPPGPPRPPGPPPGSPPAGDPVDLSTGKFVYSKTDLFLPDVMPIAVSRTYISGDNNVRDFGVGMMSAYGIFLSSTNQYQVADLNMPDAQYHFVRTSPGTSWTDAVFAHTFSPTKFYLTQIVWNGRGWNLTLKNGFQYIFGENQPLQGIKDRYGNQVTITRASGDQSGNILQVSSPNGRWIAFTYNASNLISQVRDSLGRTVSYLYDASNRLSQVTDAKGGTTLYTYDGNNNILTIQDARGIVYITNQYDANGRVSLQTQADGSTFRFTYTLDANGNVTQTNVADPRGIVRQVTFNSNGYPLTDIRALGLPEQQTVTYVRDSASNFPLTATDSLSRQTGYSYDSRGNVTGVTRLAGTSNALTTSLAYDPVFNQVTSSTDALGHTTAFGYDPDGALASRTDALGKRWTYVHDTQGRMTSTTDPVGNSTQFTYDVSGLISVPDPLGNTVKRNIDTGGRLLTMTDPLGFITSYTYDTANNLLSVGDAQDNTTAFTYDPNDNLLSVTDPRGNVMSYTYDNMDRVASRSDGLHNQETYQYDPNGNIGSFTDRRGKVTTYAYDGLNRLTFVGYGTQAGPSYESTTSYSYDAGNRLTQVIDSTGGTITRGFDNLDRMTSETTPQGTINYAYDNADRRTTTTVTGQGPISYTYDSADRLTKIAQGASSVLFGYDDSSRRTSVTLPNGIAGTYTYDNNSRVTGITYTLGQTTIGNLSYTYDAAGHEVGVGGSLAATSLPGPVSATSYNANNQVTTWGSSSLSYDANGNLTNDGTNSYVWNARNQLVSMNSGASTYAYDAFGRRVGRSFLSSSTNYLYDGLNSIQELSGGTVTANSIAGGLDEIFLRTDSSGAWSFLSDDLGSTLALADSSGILQTRYTYDPFGNSSVSGPSSSNSFEYTGRELDSTGLYYYRARYYNPQLQRFISEDPAGFLGGVNAYAYAANDPVDRRDPSGAFNCYWHKRITRTAALWAGYGQTQADSLAQQVCDVDNEPHSQDTDAAHTHQHAMRGKKNGQFETCQQAHWGTQDLVRRMAEAGDLAHALHAIQDAWPLGHYGYLPWDGPLSWPAGTDAVLHVLGDAFPADWEVQSAIDESYLLLRDLRDNDLNSSSGGGWYLPDSCQ